MEALTAGGGVCDGGAVSNPVCSLSQKVVPLCCRFLVAPGVATSSSAPTIPSNAPAAAAAVAASAAAVSRAVHAVLLTRAADHVPSRRTTLAPTALLRCSRYRAT